MRIVKYKKSSNGKYKVFLENGVELSLYEEVILAYQLLLTKEVDDQKMMEINQSNQEWDVYYVALKCISNHVKSVHDLRLWLLQKDYPNHLVNQAIEKLIQQGYLNDQQYAKSYVSSQMLTTNNGPFKIRRELVDKSVELSYIEEALEEFTDEDQIQRIHKIIEKGIKGNHSRGGVVLKQKIYQDLKSLGYDISLMNQVIESYDFSIDNGIAKREYEKLYRKYSRKYEGEELEKRIREIMYMKGLRYEEE